MIKIFWGAWVVTLSKPPPPYEQLLPLPTPCFKMFLERSLNDPPPPTTPLQASFTATPHPIHHSFPPPPKNFDHTHIWSLIMTKRYQSFLYYDTKFSFGSFSKIQADFMHFESWTGVLQVQPCFEIIYNFIFGVLFLSFKFSCLCDCT